MNTVYMYHTITFSISETLYILFKPLNQTLPNSQLLNNKSRFAKCFHKIFSFTTNTRRHFLLMLFPKIGTLTICLACEMMGVGICLEKRQ